jgi:hypothetical protein
MGKATNHPHKEDEMDFKEMADKAKQVFQQRGGAKAAKEDAQELRDITQEQGSVADKLKDAGAAIKDPGAPGPDSPGQSQAGAARGSSRR